MRTDSQSSHGLIANRVEAAPSWCSSGSEDLPTFFAARPESFGAQIHNVKVSHDSFAKLVEAHTEKFKRKLATVQAYASYDGDLKSIGSTLISEHQENSDEMKRITEDLKAEGASKKTAKERMEEGRKRAKEKSNKSIDKAYDAAEAICDNAPPDQQDRIADAWLDISEGFLGFWNQVLQGFLDIVKAFVAWLASVWDTVKNVWNDVKNVFESAWNWLRGLF
ncbi:hypothetical protein FGADI_931 [Fusarium gaditjirri]|uniref:Uncharacterized protein n=1 Tax=Fusarium gaditjirri TaxID=282569 RepID=A0A8H4TM37_9HYPO|nr:hypothetical protein FGADI_931 [Fusarium gaditjirri]